MRKFWAINHDSFKIHITLPCLSVEQFTTSELTNFGISFLAVTEALALKKWLDMMEVENWDCSLPKAYIWISRILKALVESDICQDSSEHRQAELDTCTQILLWFLVWEFWIFDLIQKCLQPLFNIKEKAALAALGYCIFTDSFATEVTWATLLPTLPSSGTRKVVWFSLGKMVSKHELESVWRY